MMNIKENIDKFLEALREVNTIYISSHVSVDADNLGSVTALKQVLNNMGKRAYAIKSDIIPKPYHFLPEIDTFIETPEILPDMYISLDSGSIERLGPNEELFKKSPIKVVIDHHSSNIGYGDINIIDPEISSTCELLYQIFNYGGISYEKDVATSLFAGISGDTGRFLYDNTDEYTYEACADLFKKGADVKAINLNLYQMRSVEKTKILQLALKSMVLTNEKRVAYTVITQEMLQESGAKLQDLDEPINYLRDIDTVICAFILKEQGKDSYKVSLRSKDIVDVNRVANLFNGGGHKKAAGLTYNGKKETLIEKLLEEIDKELR